MAGAGITVGRNGGSGVSSRYKAPFTFTGGTIAQVTIDLSGRPYEDVEWNSRLPFRATEPPARCVCGTSRGGHACVGWCGRGLREDHGRRRYPGQWDGFVNDSGVGVGFSVGFSLTALSFDPAEPVPGVETTLPDHIPPNALACFPSPTGSGRLTMAGVPDPVAPKITVPLPDGWNSVPGTGDVALTSTGPDGMSGAVTITETDLDPGGAFLRYAAGMRGSQPGVKLTVAAAQFCGYSSQQLSGTCQGPRDFRLRRPHDPHLDEHQNVPGGHQIAGARRRARIRRGEIHGDAAVRCRHPLKNPVFLVAGC